MTPGNICLGNDEGIKPLAAGFCKRRWGQPISHAAASPAWVSYSIAGCLSESKIILQVQTRAYLIVFGSNNKKKARVLSKRNLIEVDEHMPASPAEPGHCCAPQTDFVLGERLGARLCLLVVSRAPAETQPTGCSQQS